ncbi:MAG: hypothetical protein ABR559_01870 [Gemmatimonadota bacterium]
MTRPVISAEDVRAVHRARGSRLELPADALVTPLARDEADRWGIELATASPPSTTPHAPTCDPPSDAGRDEALEQIVTRVQARVPQADPAQVREISRRVLEQVRRSP